MATARDREMHPIQFPVPALSPLSRDCSSTQYGMGTGLGGLETGEGAGEDAVGRKRQSLPQQSCQSPQLCVP